MSHFLLRVYIPCKVAGAFIVNVLRRNILKMHELMFRTSMLPCDSLVIGTNTNLHDKIFTSKHLTLIIALFTQLEYILISNVLISKCYTYE